MRFKLDENLGTRCQQILESQSHDVATVRSQGLQGSADQRIYDACSSENRCLITLDLDFADVVRFPPASTGGIVILRIPRNPSVAMLERMIRQFLHGLGQASPDNQLWIVEPWRIRVREAGSDSW